MAEWIGKAIGMLQWRSASLLKKDAKNKSQLYCPLHVMPIGPMQKTG
jgi:hypothetical protein